MFIFQLFPSFKNLKITFSYYTAVHVHIENQLKTEKQNKIFNKPKAVTNIIFSVMPSLITLFKTDSLSNVNC